MMIRRSNVSESTGKDTGAGGEPMTTCDSREVPGKGDDEKDEAEEVLRRPASPAPSPLLLSLLLLPPPPP